MSNSVQRLQAEADEMCNVARQLYQNGFKQGDLADIKDKDATIAGMSRMICNMMEVAKVKDIKPAAVKRACALREAGPDRNMKRILPRAIADVSKSIARGQNNRSERERAGDSNIDKRSPGYWEDCLTNLELAEEKETGGGSNVRRNGSKAGVPRGTPEIGDLIEL